MAKTWFLSRYIQYTFCTHSQVLHHLSSQTQDLVVTEGNLRRVGLLERCVVMCYLRPNSIPEKAILFLECISGPEMDGLVSW